MLYLIEIMVVIYSYKKKVPTYDMEAMYTMYYTHHALVDA